MERTRFVIIGLGNIGLPMLKMLSRDFHLTCIDDNDEALALARQLRGETLDTRKGDATSRLVLEEAQLDQADAVVITTSTERVNIEVARVIKSHFQVPRVIAIGITARGIEELEALGVEVESIFNVSATGLRNRLEHTTKAVHGVGLGKNEILEVEIHPSSRLANKPLARLTPRNWRIGIIYRNGNIIVPTGETTLKPKDRVIILGKPKVVKTVAERLSFRFMDFPLEYGDTGFVFLRGNESLSVLDEVDYLFSILPLQKGVIVTGDRGEDLAAALRERLGQQVSEVSLHLSNETMTEAIPRAIEATGHDPAILICGKDAFYAGDSLLPGLSRLRQRFEDTFRTAACPLFLVAGSAPYETVAIPCLSHERSERSLEAGFEISSTIDCQLEALVVKPSSYIASEEELAAFDRVQQTISDLALVYRSSARRRELKGNPVRAVTEALPAYQLLIAQSESEPIGGALRRLLRPNAGWHILTRTPISTLVIPPASIIP